MYYTYLTPFFFPVRNGNLLPKRTKSKALRHSRSTTESDTDQTKSDNYSPKTRQKSSIRCGCRLSATAHNAATAAINTHSRSAFVLTAGRSPTLLPHAPPRPDSDGAIAHPTTPGYVPLCAVGMDANRFERVSPHGIAQIQNCGTFRDTPLPHCGSGTSARRAQR